MDQKDFREAVEAALARDKEYLKKIETTLQKASRRDPDAKKVFVPVRSLKRELLRSIKAYEKILGEMPEPDRTRP